jgi:hypothetical protein
MLGGVFARFVEKSPISVMVRATLERVLGADRLDLWYERTAEQQYTREILFSTVYDLMSQVVFCVQPSVRAAYLAHEADVGTSLVSVYNKLSGLETRTSVEPVRSSARAFAPLMAQMEGERAPWLAGYRVKIVDGTCLEASEHRLKARREATGRALPGKSRAVSMRPPQAWSPMSSRVKMDMRRSAHCGERCLPRPQRMISGSPIAIFVPARFWVRWTRVVASSLCANIGGCLWRF